MRISFYLDKSNLDKEDLAPIFYSVTFNGNRIRKKIKDAKCKVTQWDSKRQRIIPNKKKSDYNYHIEYNKKIDDIQSRAHDLIRYYHLNEVIPTKSDFINKLESNSGISVSRTFFDSFDEFVETSKHTKAERTIKGYTTALNYLKDFELNTSFCLDFENIDYQFFEAFRNYSFEEKKIQNNYFSKLITVLKTFMYWSADRNYHSNTSFKKFKASESNIEVIYLTMDELMRLYNFEFETTRLSQVRDVYSFAAFTGLRYSDLKNLKPSNIFDDHLKLSIQKTKTLDHTVPLNRFSKEILKKYKDSVSEPLPIISSQKLNKYLKECAELAKINSKVTITRYRGQERIEETTEKFNLITSHTARKTFITNSLVLGMNQMVVRNISNHKSEKSFLKYVNIAEDFKKKEMDNTWNKI